MRVLITGAGGFIGGAVARALRARGDEVVALVRDPGRASSLTEAGVELAVDDLSDVDGISGHLAGTDAAIHAAGTYRVGIRRNERRAMWDANVGTTTRFLDATKAAGTKLAVYVSTCNVFGNTRGRVVDETYHRDLGEGFLSWYDETKYRAHEVAEQRSAAGAPIVTVLPSQTYGPGDHSAFGEQLRRAHDGTLRYRSLDDAGVGLVHVDDLAAGVMAAMDRGMPGRSYVLSGPTTTLGEAVDVAATIGGHESPRLRIPTALLRAMAPFGPLIGQPGLDEVVSAAAGVTYWASSARAEVELGFSARPVDIGLRDTFGAA
ncbi:MAG TPA: NAD-dependent epimerase/dehydratase family protein [Candidatus Limnocylindrales bacterium]|nr:NAD-dependent epimerase/dehydratase family protein [Candidatus Limnocylindrales bacterium]